MVRRWALSPRWARVLVPVACAVVVAGVVIWAVSGHRVFVTVVAAGVVAVFTGAFGVLDERRTSRLPEVLGWAGDRGTLDRVRADVDAGTLPADPRLHEVARAYARKRLLWPQGKSPWWVPLLGPAGYLSLVAVTDDDYPVVWIVLGLALVPRLVLAYGARCVLVPRWRRVLNLASTPVVEGPARSSHSGGPF